MEKLLQWKAKTVTQPCKLSVRHPGSPLRYPEHARRQPHPLRAHASLAGPGVHMLSSQGMLIKLYGDLGVPHRYQMCTHMCVNAPLRILYICVHKYLHTHTQAYRYYADIFCRSSC